MISGRQVLILSNRYDPHADAVIYFLNKMKIDVVRFHPAECNKDCDFSIDNQGGTFLINSSGRTFHSKGVCSVWYRRPESTDKLIKNMPHPDRYLVSQETDAAMWGLYGLIDAVWYSHPYHLRIAAWKLYQLAIAKRVGFSCPQYVVSNDIEVLSKFADIFKRFVIKPIHEKTTFYEENGESYSLYVKTFEKGNIPDLFSKKPLSPVLLQEYIKKKYDVRVTVIGFDVYAVAIFHPQNQEVVDFRRNIDNLVHKVIKCPDTIGKAIIDYMQIMRLNFAAFDFVVDTNDNWTFLECNPNGQWLWIEIKTGLSLVESFAKHLALIEPPIISNSLT